jgi:hypothetical protein
MKGVCGFLKAGLAAAFLAAALSGCAVYEPAPYYAGPPYGYEPAPSFYFGYYGRGGDWDRDRGNHHGHHWR